MTLDDSYFSDIRIPSEMRVRFVDNHIPQCTPRPSEGFETAKFYNFEEYRWRSKNNKYNKYNVLSDNTLDQYIEIPLGNFGFWVNTPLSDSNGNFTVIPEIKFSFGNDVSAKKIYVFLNRNDGGKVGKIKYADGGGVSGNLTPDSDLIEITAPEDDSFYNNFTIRIISTAEPNSRISVGAIVVDGDVLEIEREDIKEAAITESGDITGAKITSSEFNIALFDLNNKYSNINNNYNCVLVNHIYKDYVSPTRLFILNDIKQDTSGEIQIVNIKCVDILTSIKDTYTNQEKQENIKNIDALIHIINYARTKIGGGNSLILMPPAAITTSDHLININPIFNKAYVSVLHGLSFIGAYIYEIDNDIFQPIQFSVLSQKIPTSKISLMECFSKPVKNEYPLIKDCSFVFTDSTMGGYDTKEFIYEGQVNFRWDAYANVFVGKIKLPDNCYIPADKGQYIFVLGAGDMYRDILDIGWSYGTEDGFLYIYDNTSNEPHTSNISVSGLKFSANNYTLIENINPTGESLELKSEMVCLPNINGIYSGTDWEDVYKSITLPYNHTKEYDYDIRGRIDINLYDTIYAEKESGMYYKCVVNYHKLTYNGAYKSELKLTLIDDEPEIYPSYALYPSETLYPKGAV